VRAVLRTALIPAVLLGCSPAPPPEHALNRQRYLDALQLAQPADLSPCAGITDPDLQGDCQLSLSRRLLNAGEWCSQMTTEPWRGECFFSAAEGARDAQKWDKAIAYCKEAGPFSSSCAQHLWQPQMERVLQPHAGRAFAASLPAAEQLYRQWLPHLGERMTTPYWAYYIRAVFRRAEQPDPAWCGQLPNVRQEQCAQVYAQIRSRSAHRPTPRSQ